MILRQATNKDEDLIKQIHKESVKEIGNFNTFFIWTNYLKGKTTYKYYIIDDVAFLRFGFSKKYSANIVYDIAILKEHRGKGYGKKIISKLPRPIMLKCNSDNEAGNCFYESIGMKKYNVVRSKNNKKDMNVWVLL
jgi:GNAT superfamily N-acetyltransferase